MKKKVTIDDGCNIELVENASFDGILEIPKLKEHDKIVIPEGMVPYSQINTSTSRDNFVCFYEKDTKFKDILIDPDKTLDSISEFKGIISPDPSLYIDEPLSVQIINIYRNRAINHYAQEKGHYIIPNVRWSDKRTFTTICFKEKVSFLGIPKNDIVSIGTYGCISTKEYKTMFKDGLREMIKELRPKVVLIYGPAPSEIFDEFKDKTKFYIYKDWISFVKGEHYGNNAQWKSL